MSSATAFARAGLAGHPSDGYGGAVLSVALRNFAATVEVEPAGALDIAPAGDGQWPEGGQPLVAASVRRFARYCAGAGAAFDGGVRIRYRSTIPREVGLGGSSAIVVATLRALAACIGTDIAPTQLPQLALAVEREELGIAAGLQDRVAQTYEGLTFMDFAQHRYEPLDPTLLPPLFVAWLPDAGGSSGDAHAAVRARFERGDRAVVEAMAALARLAHRAKGALEAGDQDAFGALLDAGFAVRASIFDLDPRHAALVHRARDLGLHATYTGSGGAIVGIASDDGAAMGELGALARVQAARIAPARYAQARSSGSGSIG